MINTAPRQTPTLTAYSCAQWNKRLNKPCDATVVDAWAPGGALIRRKCGVCGNWNLIRIDPEAQPAP